MKANLRHAAVISLCLAGYGAVRAESGSGSLTRPGSSASASGFVGHGIGLGQPRASEPEGAEGSLAGNWADYRGPSKWNRFHGLNRPGDDSRQPVPSRAAASFQTASDSTRGVVPPGPEWVGPSRDARGRNAGQRMPAAVGSGRRIAMAAEDTAAADEAAASRARPAAEPIPSAEPSDRFVDPFGDDGARAGGLSGGGVSGGGVSGDGVSGDGAWPGGLSGGGVSGDGAWPGGVSGGGVPLAARFGGAAGRPALSPWYGGFNLLFLNFENAENVRLLYEDADPSQSRLWSADVDPSASVGFDVSVGRYLANGRYGIGLTYFDFNPGGESAIVAPGSAGDFQPAFPGWSNLTIDPSSGGNPAGVGNGGADSVYNYYDEAAAFRARRNVDFQGLELNFSCFGIMGAQRAATCGGGGLLDRFRNLGGVLGLFGGGYQNCGPACGSGCGPAYGFGGAAGPLVRPCGGRIQVVASHGLRWFQFRDEFGFDANIDGDPGYQPTDLYYDVDTENDLFGYQFGGRLIYCLCNRVNLWIAGKFGLYGNRVTYRQRLGTQHLLGTYTNFPSEVVDREGCETVLSTLGELDFGLGYRVCNAWTLRGGYRILGATGVATSVGSISQDFASVDPNSAVYPGSSVVLHGGYFGAEYNW